MTAKPKRDADFLGRSVCQILDALPMGIVVRDGDGQVVFENKSAAGSGRNECSITTYAVADDVGVSIGTVSVVSCDARPAGPPRSDRRLRPPRLAGESDAMRTVLDLLDTASGTHTPVLIAGETGTGKRTLAQAIHDRSPRADGPFVVVNCAAMSGSAIARELFGRSTGATAGFGRLHGAHGGTLYLDEICALPRDVQARLLGAIQSDDAPECVTVDGVTLNVRLVAATCRDIETAVETGVFARELFYILNSISIAVPPLRERLCDIPDLVREFIRAYNTQRQSRFVEGVAPEAFDALCGYGYPGNVRELDRAIEHAFTLCRGKRIRLDHLPKTITCREAREAAHPGEIDDSIELLERDFLIRVLDDNDWKLQTVADYLGLSRTTLWRKLKRFGIERP